MAKQLLKGNIAFAEAAIRAGCEAYFGYPITPQTELLEHMAQRMVELGRVFLQAESEVAAVNMVYGAAAAGARVMTSSGSTEPESCSYSARPISRTSWSHDLTSPPAWRLISKKSSNCWPRIAGLSACMRHTTSRSLAS